MPTTPRTSLARVVEDLGSTFLEVVAEGKTPAHLQNLDGVVIYDRRHAVPVPGQAIVLGVGVHGATEIQMLLKSMGDNEAAALIVRAPIDDDAELTQAVMDSGVTLLALTEGASWLQLADMLRTILAENDFGEEVPSSLGGVPSGDLFGLANAIAALIDAPITIEDRKFRVLAFSGRQDEADSARIQTILELQVPGAYIREDQDRGTIQQLYSTADPVYVEPSAHSGTQMPRVAITVRAGDEILGSIWAAVHEPLTPERSAALSDSAKLVALHLLRRRAGADVDRRLRADLAITAIEGGQESVQALSRLGLLGKRIAVIALALLEQGSDEGDPSRRAAEHRMADAFAMHLSAVAPRSEVALMGSVAYGLVPMAKNAGNDDSRIRQIATDFLKRTNSRRGPAVIGIGTVVGEASQLSQSKMRADRALRVLLSRQVSATVATSDDVHLDALLLEMHDHAVARDAPLNAPLALLREYDARRDGKLEETLSCWLDAFGDIHMAAANAGVHPNTFRYRLKRVEEVGEINLQNSDDRFAMMLQLRLDRTRQQIRHS